MRSPTIRHFRAGIGLMAGLAFASTASAQLFDNLKALNSNIRVGNPRTDFVNGQRVDLNEYPKGLAAADLDGDGKGDWVVARLDGRLVFGWGRGDLTFDPPQVMATPADSFRQVLTADLNGDARPDVAAAAPFQGRIYLFFNLGNRAWSVPVALEAWPGARNLAALDWDGDGVMDLMIAGPDKDTSRNFEKPWERPAVIASQQAHGIVFYRGKGGGVFEAKTNFYQLFVAAKPPEDEPDSFPRPVYVLEKWRPPGQTKDWLLATHALAEVVYILRADQNGTFWPRDAAPIGAEGNRAMAVGALTHPASSPDRDLVVASRNLGTVTVFKLAYSETGSVVAQHQKLDVQGGPRALAIADVDGDGWNDLVVVSRNMDKVVVFKNKAGNLEASTESRTGSSPRELAGADFNGDGRNDFVVLNRDSASVTVLNAAASTPGLDRIGFTALDQSYPVEGDVAQLGLYDLNGDGRDDVLQLHRSSAEVSVRLAGALGQLGEPTVFAMGDRPSAMSLADINRDGKYDIVTANLGDALGGQMVVRMGDGTGSFGPPQLFRPPEEPTAPPAVGGGGENDPDLPPGVRNPPQFGNLYAVLPVDLDGDEIVDLAAGYYDCRIIFFKGDGNGNFLPTPGFSDHELHFLTGYGARFIVAGDFDQDGDQDLALAAWPGDVVVLENTGNFFLQRSATDLPYRRHFFPRFDNAMARARDIQVVEVNGDSDPDLLVGTGSGTQVLLGKPGVDFERKMYAITSGGPAILPVVPEINFPVDAMVTVDLDGDGKRDDVAAICANDGCLNILTSADDGSGQFLPALQVEAPRTTFLAAGDLDGDSKTDLVGSGSVLWVALSSRAAAPVPPTAPTRSPSRLGKVVINEILPNNTKVPVTDPAQPAQFTGGDPDSIELFNGGSTPVSVAGWALRVERADGTDVFGLPAGAVLPPGGRAVILCTRTTTGPWVAGFKLPKEGAVLRLNNGAGETIDTVTYPDMKPDESFARYSDAHPTFRINELPDPGRPNLDNGAIEPAARLLGIDLGHFRPLEPLRFYASATDDVGIVGMSVHWRQRNSSDPGFKRVLLFDDGMNGDGGRLDGVFSGLLAPGLPAGTELEFYLEAEDLSGEKKFIPGQPAASSEEATVDELYTLRVPSGEGPPMTIEISEVVSSNRLTVADDAGENADYLELRNTGPLKVSLHTLELAENLFGGSGRLKFSDALQSAYPQDDMTLATGQHRLIFCDTDDMVSPTMFHAPFRLDADSGGHLYLFGRTASGTQEIIDAVAFPRLGPDEAYARIGVQGRFHRMPPTPGGSNVRPGTLIPILERQADGVHLLLGIPTQVGRQVGLESNNRLQTGLWSPVLPGTLGDGFERLLDQPVAGPEQFYRLRE